MQFDKQDILILKNIILVAANKGIFHPDEFQVIGKLFEKIKIIEQQINQNGN